MPTFRGPDGLWRTFHPEELATREAFERDPRLVWDWYRWRRRVVARAKPNAGHRALAAMERLLPEFLVATQNVDGLHQRAGSRRVVELHGNIMRSRCETCGAVADDAARAADEPDGPPPACRCGAILRPDVVWFGEPLPAEPFSAAVRAARAARLALVVGTSSLVYPAASLPLIAAGGGARVVCVNPGTTPLSGRADDWLAYPAATALPAILRAIPGAAGGGAETDSPEPPRA